VRGYFAMWAFILVLGGYLYFRREWWHANMARFLHWSGVGLVCRAFQEVYENMHYSDTRLDGYMDMSAFASSSTASNAPSMRAVVLQALST